LKSIDEIKFGFSDAENYRRRENKNFFSQIFLRTDAMKKLDENHIFFLVGEKGTGKTAYAVSKSSSPSQEMVSRHIFIRETDYANFVNLKKENGLGISDYADVWKIILLLSVSQGVQESSTIIDRIGQGKNYDALKEALDLYYEKGLDPEIVTGLQFVENYEENAALLAEISGKDAATSAKAKLQAKAGAKNASTETRNRQFFQRSLTQIQRIIEPAISQIKLGKSFTLYVDGIDIRPSTIEYEEYLECVKGLSNAAWALNNDLFPRTKDSKGRIKVVLLLRPDIFNSLGMQNRNTKLKDNSVILGWVTDYKNHRSSPLFQISDRLFSAQQDQPVDKGAAWDHYVPFDAPNHEKTHAGASSFVSFLRHSYHRPRDIMTMLDILNEIRGSKSLPPQHFSFDDFNSTDFRTKYGEYLLGEIKDALSFYYDEREFDMFLQFFSYLNGEQRFEYSTFCEAFSEYADFLRSENIEKPNFMRTPDEFLQFLYDQNILNFVEIAEDEKFIRWCFRERNLTNISPRVKTGVFYEIHYGLANTLNTGKKVQARAINGDGVRGRKSGAEAKLQTGKVKKLFRNKGYGFIEMENIPLDVYFRLNKELSKSNLRRNSLVTFTLEKDNQGRLKATNVTNKTS
jgi:cold shock CspA family protein